MQVLVIENNSTLRRLWVWHLVRQGLQVMHVSNCEKAIAFLSENQVNVIIMNLDLEDGHPISVADYTSYRYPDTRVIFITQNSLFSDGTIFQHCQNACAVVPHTTNPDDLAAMAAHYCR